jgi:MFS transporter, YNFM family, putative membrane transport protein
MSEAAAPAPAAAMPVRPIVLLSAAAFASAATMRVADPLLPQVASEFGATAGAASVVATGFALSYGLFQVVYGPLGDRFGKYRIIALATFLSALTATTSAFAESLGVLGALRFLSGCTAAAIIPMSMAYIGDAVPYERRQPVLARFLSGQILGVIGGQVFGGVLGDFMGWRGIFIALGAIYLAIAALLANELRSVRVTTRPAAAAGGGPIRFRHLPAQFAALLRVRRVQTVLATVFVEGFLFFGGFAYFGAYFRHAFGISYIKVGGLLACFGIGGLIYAVAAKPIVARLGERGMVLTGGLMLAASFVAIASTPVWAAALPVVTTGAGFYLLHNTLQTNATQMAPHARGLAVSMFASLYFLGQAAGVALFGRAIDAVGYGAVFPLAGLALFAVALAFRRTLPDRPQPRVT